MSAEVLRQSAALMREQVSLAPFQTKVAVRVEGIWLNSRHYMPVEADFLLAVADLLDDAAENLDMQAPGGDLHELWDMRVHIAGRKALAVARTYLGSNDA